MTVFGARELSRAMSKLPQLVATLAVISSPAATVCLGASKLTCFGFGSSTVLQPAAPALFSSSEPPPRPTRIAITTAAAISAKAASAISLVRSWPPCIGARA